MQKTFHKLQNIMDQMKHSSGRLMEFTTFGYMWTVEDSSVLVASHTIYSMLEMDAYAEFFTVQSWKSHVHPKDLYKLIDAEAELKKAGNPVTAEYRMITETGKHIYVEHHMYLADTPDKKWKMMSIVHNISEYKRAEVILETMNEGFFELDENFAFRRINEHALKFWNLAHENALGKKLPDVFPQIEATGFYEILLTARAEKISIAQDILDTVTGHWLHLSVTPYSDGLIVIFHDIQNEKEAEQKLYDEHRRFKEAQAIGHVGSYMWDVATDKISWSDEMYRIHGLHRNEEITMEKFFSIVHPDDLEEVKNKKLSRKLKPGNVHIVHRIIRPDGETRHVSRQLQSFTDREGNIIHVTGLVQDITEQKRAEKEILDLKDEIAQQALAKYDSLFNSINQGFCTIEMIWDAKKRPVDYRFIEVNRAFEKQTGIKNAVGKTILEIYPDQEQHWFDIYGKIARTGEPVHFVEKAGIIDGWYDVYAFPVERGKGKVAVLFDNITERVRAEERKAYLLKLSDALHTLSNPFEIQTAAINVVGEHLKTDRVMYSDIDPNGEAFVIHDSYVSEGTQKMSGRFPVASFGTATAKLKKGQTVIIDDVNLEDYDETEKANFLALNIYAAIAIPLLKDNRLVAVLSVHQLKPRKWTDDEIVLLYETAERTWAAVEKAKAEEALRKSEEKYRTLFDSMDEGVATLELIFDEKEKVVDFRYLDHNAALTRQTGLTKDIIGKKVSEIFPGSEMYQTEAYERVSKTGISERHERYSYALDSWFDIYITRANDNDTRNVICVYNNVTERKRIEEQQAYILKLNDAIRNFNTPALIQKIACRLLGEQLGVTRVMYVDTHVKDGIEYYQVTEQYNYNNDEPFPADPVPAETYRTATSPLYKGKVSVVNDVTKEMPAGEQAIYLQHNIHSFIAVPPLRNRKHAMSFGIQHNKPRKWKEYEIALVKETAERTFEAVERAKAEEALRRNEERMRGLKDAYQSVINGISLAESLNKLTRLVTQETGGEARCAFYNTDSDNKHLYTIRGAGNMPMEYADIIDGFPIGPDSIACGLASHTGQTIIASDVFKDASWESLQPIAKKFDFSSCWSFPILAKDNTTVGTFAMFYHKPRKAREKDIELGDLIRQAAAVIITNHKESEQRAIAEDALKNKEAELDAIINETPFMMTRCTRDLRYRYVSRAYAKMLKRKPEEINGRPIKEIMNESGWKTILPRIERVLKGERIEFEDEVDVLGTGKPSYLHVAYIPDVDENGNVIGWFASIVDITERRKTEEALRQSEQRLKRMVNVPRVGVLTFNHNGDLLNANDAFLEMVGYTREDIQARQFTWKDFTPPEYVEISSRIMEQILSTGRGGPYEKEYYHKDGSKSWMMFVAADLGDGTIGEYAIDISNRKDIEQRLKELNESLECLVEQRTEEIQKQHTILKQAEALAQAGSWEYNIKTGEFLWSDGMYKLFNLEKDTEVTPSIYLDNAVKEDLPVAKKIVDAIQQNFEDFEEIMHIKSNGSIKTLRIIANPFINEKGEIEKVLGFDMDITDMQKSNEEIKALSRSVSEMNRQLSSANSELKKFSAITSNNFTEVLRHVYINLETIVNSDARNLSNASRANIRRAQAAIQKMKLLTADINNYLNLYELDVQKEKIDPNRVLQDVVDGMKKKIEEANAEVEIAALPLIEADISLFSKLMHNLIDNAIKFCDPPKKPLVKIYTLQPADLKEIPEEVKDRPFTCIVVSDNGIGLDSTESLFEFFAQVQDQVKHKGPGMGLSVCKKIMGLHGGAITAEGHIGKGATFNCFFPA